MSLNLGLHIQKADLCTKAIAIYQLFFIKRRISPILDLDNMRVIVLVNNQLPNPTGYGSAVHLWALINTLLKRGHEIHICCYAFKADSMIYKWHSMDTQALVQNLEDDGIKLHFIPIHKMPIRSDWIDRFDMLRKVISPTIKDYYPGASYTQELIEIISKISPDTIIAWTVDAVAALPLSMFTNIPRLVSLVDLDHEARAYRRTYDPVRGWKDKLHRFLESIADRRYARAIVDLLLNSDIVFVHAEQHCRWLRMQGVTQAKYLPVAVLDHDESLRGVNLLGKKAPNKKFKISLIGNVRGIATLPGLYLLANEIIPEIERCDASSEIEINIIGGGELPDELANAFDKPFVKVLGYVDDIQKEFLSTDVLLVPTPIDLGFRTRISEGFSYGCCVVAHSANAVGMPELHDGENVLLADNGKLLASLVIKCLRYPGLRQTIGVAARETFEHELNGHKVCAQMIDNLERVFNERKI